MKKNPFAVFKTFGVGLKDGILILVILATISPFVYREVLERTSSNHEVVIGSAHAPEAELADLPVRPSTPTPIPSAPTATPIPTPTAKPTEEPSAGLVSLKGGYIHLNLEGILPGMWTQVQWLAGDGHWYDVNGWGGNLRESNDVLWFVGSEHLGAEPAFRWQVYDGEGGTLLATSEEFHLPTAVKQTVEVSVNIPTK